jgi:hypothetical protein
VFGDPNHLSLTIEQPSFWHERCAGEQQLIRQRINEVRTDDFPAAEDDLDFINSQTLPRPTAERPDARVARHHQSSCPDNNLTRTRAK